MSKRRRRGDTGGNMFDDLQDAPSLEDATDEIFGIQSFPDTPTIKVKFVDIDLIYPDPEQPRRTIPSDLRAEWNPETDIVQDLFELWLEYLDPEFNLEAYLRDGRTSRAVESDEDDNPYEPTPIQESFIRLLDLAAAILREGLTNPITVSRYNRDYLIETGERRWLAFHLLKTYCRRDDDEDWSKIPARIMPDRNIWRQATENNARLNLNAVSQARQLALLTMDIYGKDQFQPITDFDYEQDFYAQVSDGKQYPFPSNQIELLLKAMGLNNPTQLRQYRAILRADRGLWQKADDENWTENAIREVMRNQNLEDGVTTVTRPKKQKKSVTTVTREQKPSVFDQARDRLIKSRREIAKYARESQDVDRMMWRDYAEQQAEFWRKLAEELDD